MSNCSYLYILVDPRHPENVRYVGVSKNPIRRLNEHISTASRKLSGQGYKGDWIRSLLKDNVLPELYVIHSYDSPEEAFESEESWISKFKEEGHSLVNTAIGGKGATSDFCYTEEQKLKRRESLEKLWASEEFKDEHVKILKEYWDKEENRVAQSERISLYFSNEDARVRQSETMKAYYLENPQEKWDENRKEEYKNSDTYKNMVEKRRTISSRESAREKGLAQFSNTESREKASAYAKRGWDSLSPEQRSARAYKAKMTARYNRAKKNNWVFDLKPVHDCKDVK